MNTTIALDNIVAKAILITAVLRDGYLAILNCSNMSTRKRFSILCIIFNSFSFPPKNIGCHVLSHLTTFKTISPNGESGFFVCRSKKYFLCFLCPQSACMDLAKQTVQMVMVKETIQVQRHHHHLTF